MTSWLLGLSVTSPGFVYGVAGIAAAIIIITRLSNSHQLDAIPTVGSSNMLGAWWAGLKHLFDARDVVQQGYEQYPSAPFKFAEQFHWMVVLSSPEHINELRKAPDDIFSFQEGTGSRFGSEYTLHIDGDSLANFVRSHVTRNIGVLYPEMRDEITIAFDELLYLQNNEWKSISVLDTARQLVCRTSNRAFVGLPLCRNPDWIDLNIQYTLYVFSAGIWIGLFPKFMKSFVAYVLGSAARRSRLRGLKHLGPIIEERLEHLHKNGNEWDGKPNDVISWLMDDITSPRLTAKSLVNLVLALNMATIHPTALSLTLTLCYLAANPQHVQPLREEVELIVEREGWSKDSVSKMHKLDSFLRECQRLEGTVHLTMTRKVLKDFTFTDGTFLPKGTLVSVAAKSLQHDEKVYEDAKMFRPFRFASMCEEDDDARYQFVSTGADYLPFGHGRHACPGRFFAANALKTMLAHVVMTYDVKSEGEGTLPLDPRTRVLFRKRV